MAFINEPVPQADHSHPLFQGGLRWPEYAPPIKPHQWTIDRSRDVFLTISRMGGPDERSVYLVLGLKGELVPIELEYAVPAHYPDGTNDMTWSLRILILPKGSRLTRDEVLHLLKEALDVQGFLYRRKQIRAVNFSF